MLLEIYLGTQLVLWGDILLFQMKICFCNRNLYWIVAGNQLLGKKDVTVRWYILFFRKCLDRN